MEWLNYKITNRYSTPLNYVVLQVAIAMIILSFTLFNARYFMYFDI